MIATDTDPLDDFVLDVRVIEDARLPGDCGACSTDNGCAATLRERLRQRHLTTVGRPPADPDSQRRRLAVRVLSAASEEKAVKRQKGGRMYRHTVRPCCGPRDYPSRPGRRSGLIWPTTPTRRSGVRGCAMSGPAKRQRRLSGWPARAW